MRRLATDDSTPPPRAASRAGESGARRVGPVSAVVVNWQGERYLPACLDALAPLDLDEILVVDNASTDGSLALLAARYPRVRVLHAGENAGPARARNLGLCAARNRFVLALDNDAVVTPGMLELLSAAAEARPDAAVVQPRSVFAADPSRVHYDGGELHYAGLIALRNFYVPRARAVGQGVCEVGAAVSVCLLVDRDALLALGGYDERFFILFEDLDLSFRLRARGHAILSVEDALVRHDAGTAGLSFRSGWSYPAARVFYHSRNRWLYLAKCYSARTLVVAAPGLALYELVWLAFALAQGGLGAWLRGKWEVLDGWRETRARRRAFQAARTVGDRELLVGGPLTLTPGLRANVLTRALASLLDRSLRAVWSLARFGAG